MRYLIEHEGSAYLRIHIPCFTMEDEEADQLEAFLNQLPFVLKAKVYERTGDALIHHQNREALLKELDSFSYGDIEPLVKSSRQMVREGEERVFWHIAERLITRFFLPVDIRTLITVFKSGKYIWKGLQCLKRGKLEVPVLDATAISAAILTDDADTASSIMFLLGLSEILENWTRKKSVDDLARSMSLNIDKVWLIRGEKEELVLIRDVRIGDEIVVRSGNIIPLDGVVSRGEIFVNQASMTGESLSVSKKEGLSVFAGTVVEEGEARIRITSVSGEGQYDRIVEMISNSEKMKSSLEDRAFAFSDKLVPVSLAVTALTYLFTRNITRAMSVLMVDYSCALKLSMPIAVLSAMQEAGDLGITVKGGKYLENYADAETIIFDKTGTLTYSEPTVAKVVSFDKKDEKDMLRIAACMEEHYPHSIANAVVREAQKQQLFHDVEVHSDIEYVVAHGVSAVIDGNRTLLGSYHFIFEDNRCVIPRGERKKFNEIPDEYSHLYLAINGRLSAVICIEDPIRPEAAEVIRELKQLGISKTMMLTGDNRRTAEKVAGLVGIDEFYAEVLPGDKAGYVLREKDNGKKVIMLGDGINDSPALSEADAGVAIREGAAIAREVSDITIGGASLSSLKDLRKLSMALNEKIHRNYSIILSFNSLLILLGIFGVLAPTTAAYLHNASTLLISVSATAPLLAKK